MWNVLRISVEIVLLLIIVSMFSYIQMYKKGLKRIVKIEFKEEIYTLYIGDIVWYGIVYDHNQNLYKLNVECNKNGSTLFQCKNKEILNEIYQCLKREMDSKEKMLWIDLRKYEKEI